MALKFVAAAVAGALLFAAAPAQCAQSPGEASGTFASIDAALVARERAYWDALQRQDASGVWPAGLIDVDISGIHRTTAASISQFVMACKTASVALTGFSVAHYSMTAVVTYKATVDQTCYGQKAPDRISVMTVYENANASWVPVAHSEVTLVVRY
jgi:hypothetical protein